MQKNYNVKHNITPQTIIKDIRQSKISNQSQTDAKDLDDTLEIPPEERERIIKELEAKMDLAAKNLDFEQAAQLRDSIKSINETK